MKTIKVLELFSGIGGMHTAMVECGFSYEIVSSYEINPSALNIYNHNFPMKGKKRKAQNIMGLTVEKLEELDPDLILMSPPCQPFTRQGLKKDVSDNRCSPLLHFISLMENCSKLPNMILLENVSGFDVSEAREKIIDVLKRRCYCYQEFLLSPTNFGIPNSRLRYYLLAKLKPNSFGFDVKDEIHTNFPMCTCLCANVLPKNMEDCVVKESPDTEYLENRHCKECQKIISASLSQIISRYMTRIGIPVKKSIVSGTTTADAISIEYNTMPSESSNVLKSSGRLTLVELTPSLKVYLDNDESIDRYLVPPKILRKYTKVLDIVTPESKQSCCFTKGYSYFALGTGSVLHHELTIPFDETYANAQLLGTDTDEGLKVLQKLRLRYFKPKEVLKLMGFPSWYEIPGEKVSLRESYKALGNSVNVFLISMLINMLLTAGPSVEL